MSFQSVSDVDLQRWLEDVRDAGSSPIRKVGVAALRTASRARAVSRSPGPALVQVRDLTLPGGCRVRMYRPTLEVRPVVLYFHGGGFVVGDLDSHDAVCRRLARDADVVVVALDYRRAPEFPAPAAIDDAVGAFDWGIRSLAEIGGDVEYGVSLAGDSAGGAIAILAAVRLREQGDVPRALFLAYPNADMTLSQSSVRGKGSGWGLDEDDLRWFVEQWVPRPELRSSPAVSPLFANLTGMPPALIATAGHDPLRDEGESLAARLGANGVSVEHVRYPELVHGFLGMYDVAASAARASDELFVRFGRVVRGLR